MTATHRCGFILALACVASLGAAGAQGGFLTNTEITSARFGAISASPVSAALSSTFDFLPGGGAGGDGTVVSQVFAGEGDLAGFNIFVYQVIHSASSSSADFGLLSFRTDYPFLDSAFLNFDGVGSANDTSFWVSGSIGGAFVAGTLAPEATGPGAFLEDTNPIYPVEFGDGTDGGVNWLPKGTVSRVFGFAAPSSLGFHVVVAQANDTTGVFKNPSVFTPTPEPASMALLFAGAPLALIWAARRRKARIA